MKSKNNIDFYLMEAQEFYPYMAAALARLTPIARPGIRTIGVDQWWRLYYDLEWLESLSQNHRAAIIALHEIGHLLRDHINILADLPPQIANIIGDLAINDDIPIGYLPNTCLHPAQFGAPIGLLEEEYLDYLPKYPKNNPQCGSGAGNPGDYEVSSPSESGIPGVSRGTADIIRDQVAADILSQATDRGDISADLLVWANARKKLPTKKPWQSEIAHIVGRISAAIRRGYRDQSYNRLSRRRIPGVILPAKIEYIPKIAVVADTSGSMSEDGSRILGIIDSICVQSHCKKYAIDTTLKNVRKNKYIGGGGTDFSDVKKLDRKFDVIIVITDGETKWPAKLKIPIIAIVTTSIPVPQWIKTVRVDPKKKS